MPDTIISGNEINSNDHKYRYLEEVIQSVLSEIGVVGARITFISDTGNLIFRADVQAHSFAIRVYKDCDISNSLIYAELFWLLDIKQKTNLSVPEPIPNQSNQMIHEIKVPSTEKLFKVVIFHWIPGETISARLNPDSASHMGEMLATLHLHANQFQLPPDCFRDENDWHGMRYFKAGLSALEIKNLESFLNRDQLGVCEIAAGIAANSINRVNIKHDFGLIHSDFQPNNIILNHGQFSIIDFDDCQFAPFSNDLAISLVSFDLFSEPELLRKAFLQGYLKVRNLPINFESEMNAFMMERRLRLLRWVSTWPSVGYYPYGKALVENSLLHLGEYVR